MSWRAARSFLKTAFLVTLPAIISIWLSARMYNIGMTEKSILAWIVLFLAAPFTLFFTFIAIAFHTLSLLAGVLFTLGRRSAQFRVFTNMGDIDDLFARRQQDVRSEPRDVTPRPVRLLKETDFER